MSYVSELRKLIGCRPIILVGATVIVYNNKGEILLNYRADSYTWGIPGGAMEIGETLEETARRELFEETGLQVDKLRLVDVLSGNKYHYVYPNGDMVYCVIGLYEALGIHGELRINDEESLELKYFSLNDLPELESRAKAIINEYYL